MSERTSLFVLLTHKYHTSVPVISQWFHLLPTLCSHWGSTRCHEVLHAASQQHPGGHSSAVGGLGEGLHSLTCRHHHQRLCEEREAHTRNPGKLRTTDIDFTGYLSAGRWGCVEGESSSGGRRQRVEVSWSWFPSNGEAFQSHTKLTGTHSFTYLLLYIHTYCNTYIDLYTRGVVCTVLVTCMVVPSVHGCTIQCVYELYCIQDMGSERGVTGWIWCPCL